MAKKDKESKSEEEDEVVPGEILAELERLSRLIRQAAHAEGLIPVQWEALRYLARANRLSNAPGALARYLGATKGTVSQTLLRLQKKGLLVKDARSGDGRSVALALTPEAHALLARDPLLALGKDIEELGGKTQRRMARGLGALLEQEAIRQKQPRFGSCADCRFCREGSAGSAPRCMKDNAELTAEEAQRLCIEHTVRE